MKTFIFSCLTDKTNSQIEIIKRSFAKRKNWNSFMQKLLGAHFFAMWSGGAIIAMSPTTSWTPCMAALFISSRTQ